MAIRRNGEHQNHPRPDQAERAEQCYRAVQLKTNYGYTFEQIGEDLECSTTTAYKLFHKGLKLMAPPDAQGELHAQRLQLEHLYSRIIEAMESTNDPAEKARLMDVAIRNIEARRRLYGAPDIVVKNVHQTQFDAEMEDLVAKFDEGQENRNAARSRARRTRRG